MPGNVRNIRRQCPQQGGASIDLSLRCLRRGDELRIKNIHDAGRLVRRRPGRSWLHSHFRLVNGSE
jgi:hypothetical protein